MSSPIDRVQPLSGRAAPAGSPAVSARDVMALVRDRVLETGAMLARTGRAGEPLPRGDLYGLAPLARDIGARLGATPVEEARLQSALGAFASAAAVRAVGLAGTPAGDQRAAIDRLMPEGSAGTVAELTDGLARAARALLG